MSAGAGLAVAPASRDPALDASLAALASAGLQHAELALVFVSGGFFGNGELAPVGRRNRFHTYTGALVVFPA